MSKILLIEDDSALALNVIEWLRSEKYIVEAAESAKDGLHLLETYGFDLVILDWMLPDLTGIEVLQKIRGSGNTTAVLMLTGKDKYYEKEEGLDAGADDYLTKPFHFRELSARVRALLRRPGQFIAKHLQLGDLIVDLTTHEVKRGEEVIKLAPNEFALLEFLLRHKNQVFSANALLDKVWPSTADIAPDSVRTSVMRLRAKIDKKGEPSFIETIAGVGYKLVDR